MIAYIIFRLLNRTEKGSGPPRILQAIEKPLEHENKKETIFGLSKKTFRDFWISLIGGFAAGIIVSTANSGMPAWQQAIVFIFAIVFGLFFMRAVDK